MNLAVKQSLCMCFNVLPGKTHGSAQFQTSLCILAWQIHLSNLKACLVPTSGINPRWLPILIVFTLNLKNIPILFAIIISLVNQIV